MPSPKTETHVPQLQYHPTRNKILLSGSTDGLVNIYNTTITDEDEALVQVINHGSVHHAGFLSEREIFALSHDELFSVHPATDPDDATQVPDPVHFGDVREELACEYVAQLCIGGQGAFIAAGNKMYVLHDFPLIFEFGQRPRLLRIPLAFALSLAQRVKLVFSCNSADVLSFYRDHRLDLVPLVSGPEWKLDQENLWRLPGGHGEEVVRSVCLDEQVCPC
jgi:hypothetical protein